MKPLIKICGIKSLKHVKVADKNGARWYGLVFFKKSPRNIDLQEAEMIVKQSPKSISPVAVTVNPDQDFINKLVDIGISNIQLHGEESEEYCLYLKKIFNIKIFKGIGVDSLEDLKRAKNFEKIASWIVLDKKDRNLYGGTGENFDWSIMNKADINDNYIISGGLKIDNVFDALRLTNAKGIDVSSGVESKPGEKSEFLISKFCNKVKSYER